ncbi:DNA polymerase delta, subunit 4-domain-containing protein [Myxozyma melibiosi]|uniref:DNA polymerase delta, subunit 4-domain-containing protein n=1 Tax=Myxozyma melibiosi TaxID=54550 RepID=A0ABR1F899_9ASCO
MPPKTYNAAARKKKSIGTPKQARLTDSFRHTKRSPSVSFSEKDGDATTDKAKSNVKQAPVEDNEVIEHIDLLPKRKSLDEVETVVDVEKSAAEEEEISEKEEEKVERLDYDDPSYGNILEHMIEAEISEPIHQSDLSTVEKVLKRFDLDSRFGPSYGMSRLERWIRAEKLGFEPPKEVHTILTSREGRDVEILREGYLYGQI